MTLDLIVHDLSSSLPPAIALPHLWRPIQKKKKKVPLKCDCKLEPADEETQRTDGR